MCFHWCSACGMLQTGMGKEKQQKAFFSFFNSILPVRRFSVGVYSFISSVRLRPVRQRCLHCCWCSLAGLDPSDSLVLLLLPLSLAHSSPHSLPLLAFSLSLPHTGFVWKQSQLDASLLFSPLWHWHSSLYVSSIFCNVFLSLTFSVFYSIIQLYFFCFSPFTWLPLFFSSWCSTALLFEQLAASLPVSGHVNACKHTHIVCEHDRSMWGAAGQSQI